MKTIKKIMEHKAVIEAGANINRLKTHIENKVPFVIGTAYRGHFSNNVNKLRNKEFVEQYVKPLGLSFIQIKGKWKETGKDEISEERSLFIMGKVDGSDDNKLKRLSDILVTNPLPDVAEKDQPKFPAREGLEGYNQDSTVMRLSDDSMIYLYDANGRVTEEWGDLGDVFDEKTEEEIYSTIKGNDFAIKSGNPVRELLELETSSVITLNQNPNGMSGHLMEAKKLEILTK